MRFKPRVAIGMEQAARKLTWECFYDAPLPGLRCNPTLVLSSGARPVVAAGYLECVDTLSAHCDAAVTQVQAEQV
jgi:hypothetical protein